MNKRRVIWCASVCLLLFLIAAGVFLQLRMPAYRLYHGPRGDQTGLDSLPPPVSAAIDVQVRQILPNYEYVSLCLVQDGKVVFIKSYARQRVDRRDVYASVSKPVTAMIVFQLLEEGRIGSLDDDIGDYCDHYRNCLPEEFDGSPMTFRHLLSHRSGVPHLSRLWSGDILDLATELDVIDKRGSYYSYGDLRLAQGRENAKEFLRENMDITDEIEAIIRKELLPPPVMPLE